MSDLYERLPCDMQNQFELAWEEIKKKHGEKITKVKKVFVLEMSTRVLKEIAPYFLEPSKKSLFPTATVVMNYVFTYHYFYTGRLEDGERAAIQRSSEYKKVFLKRLCGILMCDSYALVAKSQATKYEPEIAACDFLCDSMYLLLTNRQPIITKMNTPSRFYTVSKLLLSSIELMKAVLLQLVSSFPNNALITMRSLLELEYKILVLKKHPELEPIFTDFASFDFADEELYPEIYERLCTYAEADGRDPRNPNYQHYGWILQHEEYKNEYPSLKTLFKIVGDTERYTVFKTTSGFTHMSYYTIDAEPKRAYEFLIDQLYISMSHITSAFAELFYEHGIEFEEDDVLNKNYDSCVKEVNETFAQYKKNLKYDRANG